MKTIKTAFTASGVSLIAIMSAYPGLAFAQSSYAQQNRSSYNFNIPAKPLLTALADFTATTGIQVVRRNGGAISGQSAAVIGRQSPEAALSRMLGQSKLRYLFVDNHTISLYAPDEQPAPAKGVNAKGVTQLDMITITAPNGQIENASAVYSAPKSSVYISSEALDRFSHRTAADMLKGQPGVQVGDSRNGGGGLDVNIRGLQGQSRIAVTVDGAQQALDTYRGYAGTQQRSYIDPDLIGNVLIEKGPRFAAGAPGGIGGTVAMQTIGVADILKDGKSFGIRLKGEFSDNGISPQGPRTDGHPLWKHFVKARDNRGNIFNSDAKSGSAALAYSNEYVDFVAAYAKRNDGNYFAGKHGRDRYRIYKWWTSRNGNT